MKKNIVDGESENEDDGIQREGLISWGFLSSEKTHF